ncbi:glycosyltransferase [Oxalobacteraceae bacterium OM1]|nr:glycosyltransferase [Oxalobacteraceae bacterium OM1]
MPKVIAFRRERRRFADQNEAGPHYPGANERRTGTAAALRDSVPPVMPDVQVQVSVVVPTRGRPEMLNRCLASLVLQDYELERFEILIVDDGPSAATREVVMRWSDHTAVTGPHITYIPSPGPHGPAAARNYGWRAARGDVIAFTDDDTVARPDWLRTGIEVFENAVEPVDAVWGSIVMPLDGTPTDYEHDAKGLERAEFVTANCFCRKAMLDEIGGFDERFRFAWREDADLYFNLLTRSAKIVHEPAAVMTHPIRPAQWGVSLKQAKKVQFDALLYKKHPQLYRQKIRAKPRWDFYVTVAALVTCLVSVGFGAGWLALGSGLLWLFQTGRFCLQRLRHTSKAPSHVLEMIVTSALIPPIAVFWRAVGAFKFRVGFL